MDQDKLNRILRDHRLWIDGSEGWHADLGHADLRGADLRGADLRNANLRNADLRGADLGHADLRGADLRGADLGHADLGHADLRGANLRRADLRNTDLRNTDLWGADLWGANDAPIRVQVGPWPVYIQGGYMRIGCECHPVEDWHNFSDDCISEMHPCALAFWHQHREWLLAACEAQMQTIQEDKE